MAQFTAYANSNPVTQQQYPYVLDIQSDLLSELKLTTRIISYAPIF
jgi:toxin CcdB